MKPSRRDRSPRAILVSNHTLLLDPGVIAHAIHPRRTYFTMLEQTASAPWLALPWVNLGSTALARGAPEAAERFLRQAIARDPAAHAAHFVLVDNPPWHAKGDMGLEGELVTRAGSTFTYANISVFHPALFDGIAAGTRLALFPWAYRFVDEGRVTGERFAGEWDNVGTPAQLAALDRRLST